MAARIWLGALYPKQKPTSPVVWYSTLVTFRGSGYQAIIAKGNRIQGVEAKT